MKFKLNIFEFKSNIQFKFFFEQFDEKINIWQKFVVHNCATNFNNNVVKNSRFIDKLNRERQNDFQ